MFEHAPPRPPRSSGWSAERRQKQSDLMRALRPWEKSTGPKTPEGKKRSSQNAYKHGMRSETSLRLRTALATYGRFLSDIEKTVKERKYLEKQSIDCDFMLLFRARRFGIQARNTTNELIKQAQQFVDITNSERLSHHMDSKTRDLLIAAYRENRLAAIHIDFQAEYFHVRTFNAAAAFTDKLRSYNVPNIWVGFIKKGPECLTDVRGLNEECTQFRRERIYESVGALPHETAIVKTRVSALHPKQSALRGYLDNQGKDTLLIDGVTAEACVASTLLDAVKADRYDVIVVSDVIDMINPERYKNLLQKNADNDLLFQRRFHMAASHSILQSLEKSQLRPSKDCNFSTLGL